MAGHDEVIRHVVVLDCNIYLDVAEIVGPPFTWEKLDRVAARLSGARVPHPDDQAYDSLRTIAMCETGRFAGEEVVEVWTSSHIDTIVYGKAIQSANADPTIGGRGLGWDQHDAESLLSDLIGGILEFSGGDTVGVNYPDGNPPLDHEDGMVYGACRWLASEDPLAKVYCVTRDRGMIAAYRNKQLSGHTIVLSPSEYVALSRAARTRYDINRMRPPGSR